MAKVTDNMLEANAIIGDSRRVGAAENLKEAIAVFAEAARHRGDAMNNSDIQNIRDVEEYHHRGLTPRDMTGGGASYVTGSSLEFTLTRQTDFSFASTAQQNDNILVVTHVGFVYNPSIQQATLDEIMNLGFIEVTGPGSYQAFRRPLAEVLMPKTFNAGNVATTATTTTLGSESLFPAGKVAGLLALPIPRPVLIKRQEQAKVTIGGLAGTVAGTSPVLELAPVTYGYIANNN